jgi:hypothetical protein
MLASLGQGTYDGYQRAVRGYYQFPVVEIVAVLGAALAHMAAGALRILGRRRRARLARSPGAAGAQPTLRVRLHRWSGYYLTAVFAGHVVATRAPGLLGHPADFSFLTFSLRQLPGFFYPYYALFVVSGVYHLAHGLLVALRVFKVRLPGAATAPRSTPFWAVAGLGSAAGLVAVLALGGRFFPVDTHRFPEFQALYERFVPVSLRPW